MDPDEPVGGPGGGSAEIYSPSRQSLRLCQCARRLPIRQTTFLHGDQTFCFARVVRSDGCQIRGSTAILRIARTRASRVDVAVLEPSAGPAKSISGLARQGQPEYGCVRGFALAVRLQPDDPRHAGTARRRQRFAEGRARLRKKRVAQVLPCLERRSDRGMRKLRCQAGRELDRRPHNRNLPKRTFGGLMPPFGQTPGDKH